MPIYAKSVRTLMKVMVTAFSLQPGQSFGRQQAIEWFAQHYPMVKPGTVHCHLIRLSTNVPTRLHYNAKPHDDDVFYQMDRSHFRLFDPAHDPPPIHKPAKASDDELLTEEGVAGANEFAYEADLRN